MTLEKFINITNSIISILKTKENLKENFYIEDLSNGLFLFLNHI